MIKDNIDVIYNNIEDACKKSSRAMNEIQLIAVSKTIEVEKMMEAYACGVRDFGENKVQEIIKKHDQMPSDTKFHMIGHLQRNKVKQVLPFVDMIHSVDSIRLALEIQKEAEKLNKKIKILLEVNVAEEESKFGFTVDEAKLAIREVVSYSHVELCGFMTVAPFVEISENNRSVFKKLYDLIIDIEEKNIDNVTRYFLSMGMTNDYVVAIEEGATHIRIGTAIFGTR